MNTLFLPILLGLLQTADTVYVRPSFAVSMYVVQPTGSVRVAVDNYWSRRLLIQLVDAKQQVVYEEAIRPKDQPYRRLFNLDQLTEGTYHLQISDGRQTVTRNVAVGAPLPPPVQPLRLIRVAANELTP
ncbi:hypothetical protein ACFSUS_12495 [Spirosoma soli]|uniref:T9SS type A sorting domain-containing protein n=1 Tax=Spirosoma soli TaxID=1770529 RepID=A0ABW5M347_9BACT